METNEIRNKLPIELWEKVLGSLTPPELEQVANVCRFFQSVINDDSFYANYAQFYGENFSNATGVKASFKAKLIENGHIFDKIEYNDLALEQAINENSNVLIQRASNGDVLLHRNVNIGRLLGSENSIKVLLLLKNSSSSLLIPNFNGDTPLHAVFNYAYDRTTDKSVIPFLLDWAFEINFDFSKTNSYGQTILHKMCENVRDDRFFGEKINNLEYFFKKLEEKNISIDLNVEDKFGLTPLHYALLNGNTKTAECLINKGAIFKSEKIDVNGYIQSREEAATENHDKYLSQPIEINESIQDNHLVQLYNNIDSENEVIDLINELYRLSKMPDERAFFKSTFSEIVKLIPEKWVNIQNERGYSLAHFASMLNDSSSIELLVKKGANLMLLKEGYTPLHLAIMNNQVEAFFALINNKAEVTELPDISLALLLMESKSYEILSYCFTHCQIALRDEERQILLAKLSNNTEQSYYDYEDESSMEELALENPPNQPSNDSISDLELLMLTAKSVKNGIAIIALMQQGIKYI